MQRLCYWSLLHFCHGGKIYEVHSLRSTLPSSINNMPRTDQSLNNIKHHLAIHSLCAQACRIVSLVVDPFNFIDSVPNRFFSNRHTPTLSYCDRISTFFL